MGKIVNRILRIISVGVLLVFLTGCSGPGEPDNVAINLKVGETITFTDSKAGGMANGWSRPEAGGTWSASDNATLYFDYEEKFDRGLRLGISMLAFVNEQNPNVALKLLANGTAISEIDFDLQNPRGDYTVRISPETLSKNPGKVKLEFRILNAAVPKDLGISQDIRKLGVFLKKITTSSQ